MKDRKAHRPCHPRGSVRLPLPLLFYSRIPRLGIRSPCSGDVRLLAWLLVAACPPSGTTAGYSKLRRKFDQTAVRCLDFCVVGASPATTVCASREAKVGLQVGKLAWVRTGTENIQQWLAVKGYSRDRKYLGTFSWTATSIFVACGTRPP